ncbi:penicillin acylase family protein [Rhodobacteraceae bacterium W635]|uniref:penicillin acylase family protein n=1 Tax=Nioella halotolerans TaxID=2303578 RepID=UPI000E3C1D07|nr:penicillin acylase family protein [Rhodobacteraceae bacterium W635]
MASFLRWMIRIVTAALVLLVLGLVTGWWVFSRSIPDYGADWQVPGLGERVDIVRSNAAVPHIYGENDADVFYGLGFAHAQDRLWQMLMLRRTAQGRLSELFGERTLRLDELMRRLDLYGHARRSVGAQDAETLEMLEAYAAGVNAWLELVAEEALGRGAPELLLFPPRIAPWRPADSIAAVNMMAMQLAGHHETEVLRARASLALNDPARLADILPDPPGDPVAALPDYAAMFPNLPRYAQGETEPRDPLFPNPGPGLSGASNAWAAAPARSTTGAALLANDPHLGLTAPTIWYLARLELATGGVIGGTIPGMPGVLTGRNTGIGWGITSSYMDDIDLHVEEVNPDNPEEYRTPDGWAEFETRRSIIEVADSEPVTITLRWTENGPVIPGDHWNLGTITPQGHVMSMSWTALTDENTSLRTLLEIMRADTVEAAMEAGRHFVAPSQVLTVASRDRIGMQVMGHMPWRLIEHQSEGRIPSPGWIEENRWQGVTAYSANPRFLDPEGGILGNTNNRLIDRDYPLHVSHSWGDTQRIRRWQHLMQSRQVHTRDSFIEAQLDTVSQSARTLLPLVGRELWFTGEAAAPGTPDARRREALDLLAAWNGEMNEHLPEPLIYTAWMRALQQRLIRDDLGPLASSFQRVEPIFIERVFRDVDGASTWCDIGPSSVIETCTDIAQLALDDALTDLAERYGSTVSAWRWGDAHEAIHEHQVLGGTRLFGWAVNIRQSTSGGDNTLNRARTAARGDNPYRNVHGAGYRGVYDFADPDSSVFVTATGQSGHPLSRYYDNLGALWRRGEYIPMSLDPDLAAAGNIGVTILTPR